MELLTFFPNENDSNKGDNEAPKPPFYQRPWWQWIIALGVIIGIFAGLAKISGYDLKDIFDEKKEHVKEVEPSTSPELSGEKDLTDTIKEKPVQKEAQPSSFKKTNPTPPKMDIQQSSKGKNSPNVVNNGDGPITINYGDWGTTEADSTKNE